MKQHSNLDDLSEFDFPVERVTGINVRVEPGAIPVHSKAHCAIVRTDMMEILAIHSSNYHLTPHVDVFRATLNVIKECFGIENRHDKQYLIKDFSINEGRQVCREIVVLTEQIDGPDGHTIQFRLRQINSYDGSSRYYMLAGTYRQWCSNGAASLLGTVSSTAQKHTSRINIAAEVGKLRKAIEFFRREPELYREWYTQGVITNDVASLFQSTLVNEGMHKYPQEPKYNKKQFEILMTAWERNSLQLGRNKWAVYQAATWWASHGEGKTRSAEEISLEREPKVLAMIQSDEWKGL